MSTFQFCVIISSLLFSRIDSLGMELNIFNSTVVTGDDVTLICSIKLGKSSLYSLKWFKDGVEFFRCFPQEKESTFFYPTKGVKISKFLTKELHRNNCTGLDEQVSGVRESRIRLLNVSKDSFGKYYCEVSEEGPLFTTKFASTSLEVYQLPEKPPKISGIKIAYKLGSLMKANCTSGPSFPPPVIDWKINDLKLSDKFITNTNIKTINGDRRRISRSEVTYPIKDTSFNIKGLMVLECQATIMSFYNKSTREEIYLDLTISRDYRDNKSKDGDRSKKTLNSSLAPSHFTSLALSVTVNNLILIISTISYFVYHS